MPPEAPTTSSSVAWWGSFALGPGAGVLWEVGPLTLGIRRLAGRWLVSRRQDADPLLARARVELPWSGESVGADAHELRIATAHDHGAVTLTPRLADRAVVARPLDALLLLPDDEAEIFVSSPLWLQLRWPAVATPLLDVPTFEPSATWFGPSRTEGELCFATRTRARAGIEELPTTPGRAITRTRIQNRSDEPLRIERIKLPVDRLALYVGSDGALWTDGLTYVVDGRAADADVRRGDGPLDGEGEYAAVSEPRRASHILSWKHAISALLG